MQTEELFQEIQKLEKKRNRRDILKQHTLRASSGLKRFVESRGLGEALAEYLKSLASKTMGQKLKEAKAEAAERNWKRADDIHRMPEKERGQRQEL